MKKVIFITLSLFCFNLVSANTIEQNNKIEEFQVTINPFQLTKDIIVHSCKIAFYVGKTPYNIINLFKKIIIDKLIKSEKVQVVENFSLILKDIINFSYQAGIDILELLILFAEVAILVTGSIWFLYFINSEDVKRLLISKCISCKFAPILGLINKAPSLIKCSVFCKTLNKIGLVKYNF